MLSIHASTASFYQRYEASKADNEKPTYESPENWTTPDSLPGILTPKGRQTIDALTKHLLEQSERAKSRPTQEEIERIQRLYGHPVERLEATRIDNDTPLRNKTDETAGDDAEVFDAETQTWQPTQALGEGLHANLGDAYREAIDFEIKADNMGGWQRV